MDTFRAFIALEIPQTVQQILSQQIELLKKKISQDIRWEHPQKIHLTLKFLGDINKQQYDRLIAGLLETASHHQPFELSLERLGAFPNNHKARVLWAGFRPQPLLLALQGDVEALTCNAGFAAETRPFSAHLTLGRVRPDPYPESLQKINEALHLAPILESKPFGIGGVSFFKSELRPSGSIYTRLSYISFKKPD
jgi:2'-5' RNA ligase